MANEMKTEFESYVRQLAETISKEIYLEDLQTICERYMDQLETCKELFRTNTEVEHEILTETKENMENLNRIKTVLDTNMTAIQSLLQEFQKEYDKAIEQYSVQVNSVNEELRNQFLEQFSGVADEVREELKKELITANDTMKETLKDTITSENLKEYMSRMQESTEAITKGIMLLDGGYTQVFTEYTEKLDQYNQEQQTKYRAVVESYVRAGMKQIIKRFDVMLKEQQNVVEEKIPDKQAIEQMGQKVSSMCARMEEMQVAYEQKLNCLVDMFEVEQQQRAHAEQERLLEQKYSRYTTLSNTVLLFMVALLLYTTKPWNADALGGEVTAGVAIVTVIYVLVSLIMWKKKSGARDTKTVTDAQKSTLEESEKDA